jgi:hypothetical protein
LPSPPSARCMTVTDLLGVMGKTQATHLRRTAPSITDNPTESGKEVVTDRDQALNLETGLQPRRMALGKPEGRYKATLAGPGRIGGLRKGPVHGAHRPIEKPTRDPLQVFFPRIQSGCKTMFRPRNGRPLRFASTESGRTDMTLADRSE